MRKPTQNSLTHGVGSPVFIEQAQRLAEYLKTLSVMQIAKHMQVSPALATKTHQLLQEWTASPKQQTPAIDCFLGDIYSGFQTNTLTATDRKFADDHLRILSGLYGILKPLDGVYPYRLEMAYKFPEEPYTNLYSFWADRIAKSMENEKLIINLSSVEYSKTVLPYLHGTRVITPKFMTIDANTQEPKFVVVHAKIARGAFARWLIQKRITNEVNVVKFDDLNYRYDANLSSVEEPVFVAKEFGGLGLSVRLT